MVDRRRGRRPALQVDDRFVVADQVQPVVDLGDRAVRVAQPR